MPMWWGKFTSKDGNKKANKQQKLKTVYEEKCNDKSRGLRRHGGAETVPERGFNKSPVLPSRSLSPSKFVTSCFTSFTAERPNNVDESLPFPSQGLHLPYYYNKHNDVYSGRQKLESTRGSKSSLNFPLPKNHHVSNRRELELEDLDTSSCGSGGDEDIIIDDPVFLSRHPRLYEFKNGNKIDPYRTTNVMRKYQSPPAITHHGGRQQRQQQVFPLRTSNAISFRNANSGIETPSPNSPGSQIVTSPSSSRWKKGKFLGRGSYGQVYAGFNRGHMCAMKEVTLCPDDPKSRECAKQLGQVGDKLYVYLEYCAGGSIYTMVKNFGELDEDIIGEGACVFSLKGSPHWMAPEVIKNSEGCNQAVDIWSLGCTVLEMLTTLPPWGEYEGAAAMFKIAHTDKLPPIPESLSDEGKYFIKLCLQRDPKQRPSATQLLQHPFVMSITSLLERPIQQHHESERMSHAPSPRYASSHIASRTSSLSQRSGLNNDAAMPIYQTQHQIFNPYAASGSRSPSPCTSGSNTSHRTTFSPEAASGVIRRPQSGFRLKEKSSYQVPGRNHDPYVMQSSYGMRETTTTSFKKNDVGSHNKKMTIQRGGAIKSHLPDRNPQSVSRNHMRRN
ncbi:hypothetical protein RIF29_37444 [Crotalaria pallida]|uniref:mitogen-activated protein kinase kinase kinase n=1 Tax=Crotalaria pallida TaxID=3830 RepID=A0AAN9ECP5_CROPI